MPFRFVMYFQKAGLKEYYSISDGGQIVKCNLGSNGYRLPSEAEWQYACKASTTGYTYGKLHDIAWYNENSNGEIHDVGQKEPNAWGLYDMLGNVWEWCYDLYDETVYGSYRIFVVVVGLKQREGAALLVVVEAILHFI